MKEIKKNATNEVIEKTENWETASKFLAMVFGISDDKRKELTEKVKEGYYKSQNEVK